MIRLNQCGWALAGSLLIGVTALAAPLGAPESAEQLGREPGDPVPGCETSPLGSPYIPIDSWVYQAVMRLTAMGYVNTAYLGMRPWTRASVSHMLRETEDRIQYSEIESGMEENRDSSVSTAEDIYEALIRELKKGDGAACLAHGVITRVQSVYEVARVISGKPLRDSFHLGSTIINDYGRPYESGINNYSGIDGYASEGRLMLYARAEFRNAQSGTGYSTILSETLSGIDQIPFTNTAGKVTNQATIPMGPIAAVNHGRVMDAYVSVQFLNHVISIGKQDDWLGPGTGGAFAYSNNSENIYSFRINRIEPLYIPLLSRLVGPFRYEFLVGSLKGHTYPNDPWVHVEKISFKPTGNAEFGFERTVIWGGEGHVPITIRTFLQSFLSTVNVTGTVKNSTQDPGARFGAFDFSFRLPFVRNWLTVYSDAEAHDDVNPIDAPRHACIRPGLYLSHVPRIRNLDMRAEAVSTDPPTGPSHAGTFEYWEGVQRQGYTNEGAIFGDWIGRAAKGGQGWITYHMSGNELMQIGVRREKSAKDFIPGGTTLNDVNFLVVKQIGKDFEINGSFALELYKAPIYLSGQQTVTTTTIQLTWFPARRVRF
jgi:hypothetical protein